jgi:hypothetical protein
LGHPRLVSSGSVTFGAFARGLVRELRLLERHTHRSGRDTVDHGRNGSDDFANSCPVVVAPPVFPP